MFSLLLSLALADEVELGLDRVLALREPPPVTAPPAWSGVAVVDRAVRWTPTAEGWVLSARWQVLAAGAGWMDTVLAGPTVEGAMVTVDGRPASVVRGPDGLRLRAAVRGVHTVELSGVVPGVGGLPEVCLLASSRGRVELAGEPLRVLGDGRPAAWSQGAWWTGAGCLSASPVASASAGLLMLGEVAVGLTVGDGEVRYAADVGFLVRRGSADVVAVRGLPAAADLAWTLPSGAVATRSGDRLEVRLARPVSGRVAVGLSWSASLVDGAEAAVPSLSPEGALRSDRVVVVARDTDREVLPDLRGGAATAPGSLPDRYDGLVRGAPVVARTGEVSGVVRALSFQPAEQPPLLVDVADWVVAVSEEGRAVAQGSLTVRNERASHLVVGLKGGQRLLAVQVDGVPVAAAPVDGGFRVALPRSVETAEGPLAFPVELTVLDADGRAWAAGRMAVRLPSLDAPVAVRRTTLNLPRGAKSRAEVGEDGVVDDFTEGEGLGYGFGAGVDEAQATALYKDALQRWMENDFDGAQEQLDQLRGLGADNANVGRLQSNLDVVASGGEDGDLAARRVIDLARSRALSDEQAQIDVLREAEEAMAEGDYERASSGYAQAAEIATKLKRLEQKERVEQAELSVEVEKKAEEARKLAPPPPPAPPKAADIRQDQPSDDDGMYAIEGEVVGVIGGMVSGVGYGEAAGYGAGASAAPPAEPARDRFEAVPASTPVAETLSLRAPKGPVRVGGRSSAKPMDVAEDAEPVVSDDKADGWTVEVTATSASVVVPAVGEVVRVQQLLLAPGEDRIVSIAAKAAGRGR